MPHRLSVIWSLIKYVDVYIDMHGLLKGFTTDLISDNVTCHEHFNSNTHETSVVNKRYNKHKYWPSNVYKMMRQSLYTLIWANKSSRHVLYVMTGVP